MSGYLLPVQYVEVAGYALSVLQVIASGGWMGDETPEAYAQRHLDNMLADGWVRERANEVQP